MCIRDALEKSGKVGSRLLHVDQTRRPQAEGCGRGKGCVVVGPAGFQWDIPLEIARAEAPAAVLGAWSVDLTPTRSTAEPTERLGLASTHPIMTPYPAQTLPDSLALA